MSKISLSSKLNRQKVLKNLSLNEGVVYLKGGDIIHRKWTDVEESFRQESYFFYMTGVQEPGFHYMIDLATSTHMLFLPRHASDHVLWCGEPMTLEEAKSEYGIDHVFYADDISSTLTRIRPSMVYLLQDTTVDFSYPIDRVVLKDALIEARLYKSEYEIAFMREACRISCLAHIKVMKAARIASNERQLHSIFVHECFSNGASFQAYTPIVAGGKGGAVLHYIKNNAPLPKNLNDMILIDAGCEYNCYASDITRTYPIGGKFEGDYKTVYQMVLDSQVAVINALKCGVEYEDLHRLANSVICDGLMRAGLIKGEKDELLKNHIPALFFPHGLGHSLGLDVHDVGGYPKGVARIQEPGIKYMRMRRQLKANMVVTIEPGVYFVDAILDPAIKNPDVAKFLDLSVLARFKENVGGVRIEDNIVIKEDGIEILSRSLPKEISEIEALMT